MRELYPYSAIINTSWPLCLQVSDAEVAIASDDDVRSIVVGAFCYSSDKSETMRTQGDDTPVDFSTYLRHLQPSVEVEDRCQCISHLLNISASERLPLL